jgi:hypothetical protein
LKKKWERAAPDRINVSAALPFAFRDGRDMSSCHGRSKRWPHERGSDRKKLDDAVVF